MLHNLQFTRWTLETPTLPTSTVACFRKKKRKKKNQVFAVITANRSQSKELKESRVCFCVSRPCFCEFRFSGEEELCWHGNIAEGWPVAFYPACVPAFCLWTPLGLKGRECLSTKTPWPLHKMCKHPARLDGAHLFDEMFDGSLSSANTPHVI